MKQFPYYTLSISLLTFTLVLFSIYADIHWPILTRAHEIKFATEQSLTKYESENADPPAIFLKIKENISKLIESGGSALQKASFYRFTGILCFIVSIVGVFREKGKWRFFLLPVGVVGGISGIIVM